jgi:hypothetical protein
MPQSTQCRKTSRQDPERLPGLRVPVEVVDVLVALGRVLGVLEGAVRALLEPLGVLREPRVVGGGVERDVERHVHAVLVSGDAQVADVLLGPELGVHGEVPALGGADRVRGPGVVGPGDQRVVAALAVLAADGVEREQVEDVEAEIGDVGHDRLDALEAAPGAREQLIPGREARPHAVDLDRDRLLEARRPFALLRLLHRLEELRAERDVELLVHRRVGLQDAQRVLDRALRVALAALERPLEEDDALRELAAEVLVEVGVDLAAQFVVPRRPAVRPGLEAVEPRARRLDREHTRPADAVDVGVDRGQLGLEPAPSPRRLELHDRLQLLVAVAEDVGGNGDGIAYGALDCVPPVVEDRGRLGDSDPARAFTALRCGHLVPQ